VQLPRRSRFEDHAEALDIDRGSSGIEDDPCAPDARVVAGGDHAREEMEIRALSAPLPR
jgi:hypothetical protein